LAIQSHTTVASARPVDSGAGIARAVRGAATLGRREVFLWLAVALLCQQLFAVPADALEAYIAAVQSQLASKSVFAYVAWYAVFSLIADSSRTSPARLGDMLLAVAVMASGVLTARSPHWLALTAAALYLMARDRDDITLRAAGAVMLALAFNGFWGPRFFEFFAYYLLQADAALVGAALSATKTGILWSETVVGATADHAIIVYGPCSSFHNISLGLVCWVALTKLARPRWVARDIWVGLAVVAVVIALNASRLYLMSLSVDGFVYWHEGAGAQIFAWATTLSVLAISLFGALRVGRAP
jgi:hypothetical protein